MTRPLSALLHVLVVCTIAGSPIAGQPPFTAYFEDLSIHPGESVTPRIYGISPDGAVFVGSAYFGADTSEEYLQAMLWTESRRPVPLGDLPRGRRWSSALAVSNGGRVVVGSSEAGPEQDPDPLGRPGNWTEGFRWTEEEGMVGLGSLATQPPYSEARGVTADGELIVGLVRDDKIPTDSGFVWTRAGGMQRIVLAEWPLSRTEAFGISADGTVIAGQQESREMIGFRRTQSGFEPLGMPSPDGFVPIHARAVSGDGRVLVGRGSSASEPATSEAFRWSADEGFIGLGGLSDQWAEKSVATGVSGDGSVIVGYTPLGAFLWTSLDGLKDLRELVNDRFGLDLSQWSLERATGVSADGLTVVGYGERITWGQSRNAAWILRLPTTIGARFQRAGDVNQDADLNISDVIYFLEALFVKSDAALPCQTAEGRQRFLDVNQDRRVDITDPIALAAFLFLGGPPPLSGALCAVIEGCDGGPGCKP